MCRTGSETPRPDGRGSAVPAGQGPIGWTGVIPPALTGQTAGDQFQTAINGHAELLWDETQRIEAAMNPLGAAPQFTSAMVQTASQRVADPLNILQRPRKRTLIGFAVYAGGLVSSAASGVSGNYLSHSWGLVVFPVSLCVLLGCGVYGYFRAPA